MSRKAKLTIRNIWLSLLVFVISLLVLSPFYLVFINSFKSLGEITYDVGSLPSNWDTGNYVKAWSSLNFPRAFLNSLIITVLSNVSVVLISSMAAYRISRHSNRRNRFLYTSFIAQMILPFQVVMIPLTVVLKALGLINTLPGVIFAYSGLGVAMGVFMYSGFIKSLPKDLEEAALIDGC